MSNEDIAENILTIFNAVTHALPDEKANFKSMFIKFTMSQPVEVTDKGPVLHHEIKKAEVKKE